MFSKFAPKRKICFRNEYFAKAQRWGIITTSKRDFVSRKHLFLVVWWRQIAGMIMRTTITNTHKIIIRSHRIGRPGPSCLTPWSGTSSTSSGAAPAANASLGSAPGKTFPKSDFTNEQDFSRDCAQNPVVFSAAWGARLKFCGKICTLLMSLWLGWWVD